MTIYEQAKHMERESKKVYEDLADLSANSGIKTICQMLAKLEQNHYDIFDAMEKKSKTPPVAVLKSDDVIKIFRSMKKNDASLSIGKQQTEIYRTSLAAEEAAADLYKKSAETEQDGSRRAEILSIADEEVKHARFISAILELVSRPNEWLENAEWNNLKDY